MPGPIKTFRQICSLVRKNPGATAKRIVSINNAEKARQSALNALRQSNLDLGQAERDVANAYKAYGLEPLDFDPERYFGYYDRLNDRNQSFYDWKRKFAPVPDIKVFAEPSPIYRTPGYPEGNFMGQPTQIFRSYQGIPVYPTQIEIGGRRLEQVPLSNLEFIKPYGGYVTPPVPKWRPAIAPTPTFDLNPSPDSYDLQKSFTHPYRSPFTNSEEIESLPFKKGGKIHIKKENRGKFTDYCGGKVTSECIARGKASSNPAIRKRATFAANARKWKH